MRPEPCREGLDARALTCEQAEVADAAAGLDEARGGQVGSIHDEGGGQLREGTALVGERDQHARDAQIRRTDRQLHAEARADSGEQLRIGPHLAGRRNVRGGPAGGERLIRHQHAAAQRVAGSHRRDVGELAGIAVEHHRQQVRAARTAQAAPRGLGEVLITERLWRAEAQVRRQHAARLQRHRRADAAHQETDPGECRHRDGERQQQHPELAGAPLAQQHTQRQP